MSIIQSCIYWFYNYKDLNSDLDFVISNNSKYILLIMSELYLPKNVEESNSIT